MNYNEVFKIKELFIKNELVSLFSISLLTTSLYIYIYKNDINIICIFFVLDRIATLIIGYKIKNTLDFIDSEIKTEKNEVRISNSINCGVCTIGIFMLMYIIDKYPKLYVLLILSKLIDKILREILKIYTTSFLFYTY